MRRALLRLLPRCPWLPVQPALIAVYLSALAAPANRPPRSARRRPPSPAAMPPAVWSSPKPWPAFAAHAPPNLHRNLPADAEFLSALLGSIAGDGLAAVRVRALPALGGARRRGTAQSQHVIRLSISATTNGEDGMELHPESKRKGRC